MDSLSIMLEFALLEKHEIMGFRQKKEQEKKKAKTWIIIVGYLGFDHIHLYNE